MWIAIAASWGIALFGCCLQVPANRAGAGTLSLGHLKWDCLWAGLCPLGAVYFVFRA